MTIMESKPNLILIMADQTRADCIEIVNDKIKTPNINRIANNGGLWNALWCMA